MACGTPVLISNQVNIWREITEDGAGFAEDNNRGGTARLLTRWLDLPNAAAEKMRQAAKDSFAKRFEIQRATESLLEVMQRYGVRSRSLAAATP